MNRLALTFLLALPMLGMSMWMASLAAAESGPRPGLAAPATVIAGENAAKAANPAKTAKTANAPESARAAKTATPTVASPGAAAATAIPPPAPAKEKDAPAAFDIPPNNRLLTEGEMLIVNPGQNLTVESPPASERRLPVLDQSTGAVGWVLLPARRKQVVAIRWLDTSNIKKLVEIEMLEGDLFLAANPREQTDLSLAVRGRKTGVVFDGPGGWTAVEHRSLRVHLEVDASLRVVGYGHSLLPAAEGDPALALGLHIFASLRPGASIQNAGATMLVVEQYSTTAAGTGWSDKPKRVPLPPDTSLSTNGGRYDLRHFYVAEPGQPAGPPRIEHVGANPPEATRARALQGAGGARAADANVGILP